MNISDIAKCCHELNKAFCESNGDYTQPSWDNLEGWLQKSTINAVEYVLKNPDDLIYVNKTKDRLFKAQVECLKEFINEI